MVTRKRILSVIRKHGYTGSSSVYDMTNFTSDLSKIKISTYKTFDGDYGFYCRGFGKNNLGSGYSTCSVFFDSEGEALENLLESLWFNGLIYRFFKLESPLKHN